MEVKKTDKASLKGSNMLYFLFGLNAVLLLVFLLFNYRKPEPPPVKIEKPEIVETTEAVIISIPEPETPPPPPPPDNEPPPPPPPEVPMQIEETPEPVEVPDLAEQEPVKPQIPTGPVSTGPVKKVDLSGLKKRAAAAPKEERTAPVTINRVQNMAIYPGCEKYRGNKRELIKCFGKEFGEDILRFMDNEFPDIDKEYVAVKVEFHVDKDGTIKNVNPKFGDDIFKPESKRAVEKAAAYLKRRNRLIEPATMADGSKATLIFSQRLTLKNPDY